MYKVSKNYLTQIYSGDSQHKIKLLFNNIELENANTYVEKLSIKSRIIPNGNKFLKLESFVSKEATLILHDIDINTIKDQVNISIGTLVGNAYEYVPIGIFNIQDKPKTDKNKITIKLRDNSVKFDFFYNGKELIDSKGGSATKLEILQDICTKAGVTCNINSFINSEEQIGIYDNTITARKYISYLAGSGGAIPIINRSGELEFIYLNNLEQVEIPRNVIEKYAIGESLLLSKVEYESGIIKYSAGENTNDTLYLDSANPYISSNEQLEQILAIVNGFSIDSIKTGKILGNPAIEPYDIITITDKGKTYKTLATNEFIYNGVFTQTFDTQIGIEDKKTNVSIANPSSYRKYAKTEIDNVKGEIILATGKVDTLNTKIDNNYQEIVTKFDGYAPKDDIVTIENSVKQLQTDTYTKTEINTKLTDGSVTKVNTTSGTFDENGMHYEKTNAKTKATINEVGVEVDSTISNEELLFAGYDEELHQTIVRTENLTVRKYFVAGKNSRIEDYEGGGGIFTL